jgi:hypothetical protein
VTHIGGMTEQRLAKYGWMVKVSAQTPNGPREQWFMAGFPDEKSAEKAVRESSKALAQAAVKAHRELADAEIKNFNLMDGEAKQYA